MSSRTHRSEAHPRQYAEARYTKQARGLQRHMEGHTSKQRECMKYLKPITEECKGKQKFQDQRSIPFSSTILGRDRPCHSRMDHMARNDLLVYHRMVLLSHHQGCKLAIQRTDAQNC